MLRRIPAVLALACLTGLPALAQQAETPPPAPAPAVQDAPSATDTNLPAEPKMITPARKSNCSSARQVMS